MEVELVNKETRAILDQMVAYGPSATGAAFQQYREMLTEYDEGAMGRDARYAIQADCAQSLVFAIDALPTLTSLLKSFPRFGEVSLVDIGPGYGAGTGLLADIFAGHFLGPKLKVDALDIHNHRENFMALSYPAVRFITGQVTDLPDDVSWDVTFCSNVIEHTHHPEEFIDQVTRRARHFSVFSAPYDEHPPLSTEHFSVITEKTFSHADVVSTQVYESAGWQTIDPEKPRRQILAVLKGRAPL